MARTPIQFTVNGEERGELVEGGTTLLALLRDRLGVTSPKAGCLQGTCGTCTVLVGGEPQLACLTLAVTCDGATIETVERMASAAGLHPLQEAFMEHFAAQCGFCTSGMLMAAKALLDRNPQPSRAEVLDAIAGNVCRCTGYTPIVEAILAAAARPRARSA
jgi:carbon-monoxide dehydrogenase small subunit